MDTKKDERQCPRCDAPAGYKQYIRAPFENAIEVSYVCGAKRKIDCNGGEPQWIKECDFKINNEYY